jgi:RNA polymerase primary sigma factor
MIAEATYLSSPSDRWSARQGPMARARRILGKKLRFVDHPSFDDPAARDAILAPIGDSGECGAPSVPPGPEGVTPSSADRSRAGLLSREEEAHLFRKMNYLKCRATRLKEQLDPERPSSDSLDEIERVEADALAVKNRIVERNLRLVFAIAKTRARMRCDVSECISAGNLALVRAVDGFDFARGNRFSTYATCAIRNVLARHERRSVHLRAQPFALVEKSLAAPDNGVDEHGREEAEKERRLLVWRWLAQLEPRERRILVGRFGIGGSPEQTLTQIARELGISKERVRQIVVRARAKLRKIASLEGVDPLDI